MVLALSELLGLQSINQQRAALSAVVCVAILVMGVLGRKVAGPTIGPIAAGIVAINPLRYQSSGILMSESVYLIAIPAMFLVAISCVDRPTPWCFLGLGIVIALAVLIRSEAIDFVILLGLPVLFLALLPWEQRLMCGTIFLVGIALVLGPWIIRNEIQLGGASLSTNGGVTLAGSYCPSTFDPRNSAYGSFDVFSSFGAAGLLELHSQPPGGASRWSELRLTTDSPLMQSSSLATTLGNSQASW